MPRLVQHWADRTSKEDYELAKRYCKSIQLNTNQTQGWNIGMALQKNLNEQHQAFGQFLKLNPTSRSHFQYGFNPASARGFEDDSMKADSLQNNLKTLWYQAETWIWHR